MVNQSKCTLFTCHQLNDCHLFLTALRQYLRAKCLQAFISSDVEFHSFIFCAMERT